MSTITSAGKKRIIEAIKIAFKTITFREIADSTIVGGNIDEETITALNIQSQTLTSEQIAAGAILANNIAAGAITSEQIAANTILAGNIAAGTITGNEIDASTITGDNIAAGSLTAEEIEAGTITGDKIAANTITGDNIDTLDLTTKTLTADTGVIGGWDIGATELVGPDGAVIRSGQTDFNVGTGFWLGNVGGEPKFSFGIASGDRMYWDSENMFFTGKFVATSVINSVVYLATNLPIPPTDTGQLSPSGNE